MSDPPVTRSDKLLDAATAVLLVMGLGAPALLGVATVGAWATPLLGAFLGLVTFAVLVVWSYRLLRGPRRWQAVLAARVLVLAVLPVWGLIYSHFLGTPSCTITTCQGDDTAFRPFAEPEVFGLIALHVLTALAYAVSLDRKSVV